MREPVILDLPEGSKLTRREMELAHRAIIGGFVVKNRNGPLSPGPLTARDYLK